MTPKGLLRLKEASSTLGDLTGGGFQPVIDDAAADKSAVTRLVLCSGQGLLRPVGHEAHAGGEVAVARIEQLYPFPTEAAAALVASYAALDGGRVGPGGAAEHGAVAVDPPPAGGGRGGVPLRYIGRPWRASPSEGYPTAHGIEQDRIARDALTV